MNIARLEKLDLRTLWKHEAHGFTKWLCENLDFISDTIGIELNLIEREASAGPFSADILAEDLQGHPVVIENQLEQTDHDHLGKLITFMSNLDARIAIWITRSPRPEHEKAVHWLNETLPADTAFYLLKVEAYKIGNSDPAPLLSIVAGPSKESKQIGVQKKELAERHVLRLEFWKQLLEKEKKQTKLFERISPGTENWIGVGAGKSGLEYTFVIRMQDANIELYIDRGKTEVNEKIFNSFYANKELIEQQFGGPLEWRRPDGKQSCQIRYFIRDSGLLDQEKWPSLQEKMIDAMRRFHAALNPHIQNMEIPG